MKKWQRNTILAVASATLTALIIPALFASYNKENLTTSSAFKEQYIPLTKKGNECLELDQELRQQSVLLAGTMALARKELSRIAQEDFKIDPNYEPIIKTAIQNFTDAQDSQALALKNTNNCWVDLKRLIEETSVAAGVYEKTKVADPVLVQEESDLNKAEQSLRTKFLEPINGERLYENFVKMASTTEAKKLRELLATFDEDLESLILFREGMIDITTKRTIIREKFYTTKKDYLAKALSSNTSSSFFRNLWPF